MQDRPLDRNPGTRPHQRPRRPYCSYQLMLLGAEVVKVEMPGQGDLARHLGPDPDSTRPGSARRSWRRTRERSRSS